MGQGRSTRTRSRRLAATAVMAACLLGPPAAAHAATTVTPEAGGTLRIAGDDGVNAVALRNADFEPYRLYIYDEAPSDFPDPDGLELAATALGCVDGTPIVIVCDADRITRIELDLGDGRDYVDVTGLTHGGDVAADMGPGDDVFTGGPLREQVSDGRGADRVSADTIVQPDVGDPATQDGGDVLEGGTVSYAARHRDVGVTVTLDHAAGDGAPGENDDVGATGVNGTPYADTLTGSAGADALDGRGGDDTIDGGAGDDTLTGGTGGDTITGGDGVDGVSADPTGSAGDDTLHMEDGQADGRVVCGRGADTVTADPDVLDSLLEPLGIAIPDLGCDLVTRVTPDRTAPALAMTTTPPATTEATDATFAWTVDDATATETCALDGAVVACAGGSARLTGLATGAHSFSVRAVDGAGNASDAAYAWTIMAPSPAPAGAPEPTVAPVPPVAAARFKRPAGGRIRLESRNKLTLRFDCPASCAAQTLEVRAKGARLPVRLKAGQRVVRVTAPKRLATAIRGAGKRGLKAALTANGTTVATLRLYAKR